MQVFLFKSHSMFIYENWVYFLPPMNDLQKKRVGNTYYCQKGDSSYNFWFRRLEWGVLKLVTTVPKIPIPIFLYFKSDSLQGV